ncbi:MAG: YceI family protein [Bermanella sp.]
MKTLLLSLALTSLAIQSQAASYAIDTKGAHAFVQFKIKHLGYSWLVGQFEKFDGSFEYDKDNTKQSSILVNIDTRSLDTNHAERDKHLKGKDFLNVSKYPSATFKSTSMKIEGDSGVVTGNLNMHGVDKTITIDVSRIGEGNDPWGSYRAGFEGTTTLKLEDFNIANTLGPASGSLEMLLNIEGIRQQ